MSENTNPRLVIAVAQWITDRQAVVDQITAAIAARSCGVLELELAYRDEDES